MRTPEYMLISYPLLRMFASQVNSCTDLSPHPERTRKYASGLNPPGGYCRLPSHLPYRTLLSRTVIHSSLIRNRSLENSSCARVLIELGVKATAAVRHWAIPCMASIGVSWVCSLSASYSTDVGSVSSALSSCHRGYLT